jgi:YidC/Oxa1 family membrane protein insertase
MEKRVILAMLLSLVVLLTYQILMGPPPVPVDPAVSPPVAAPVSAAGAPAAGETKTAPAATTPPPATPAVATAPGAAVIVGDTQARDIVVDADEFVATFTSAGASLKSWRLKHHPDHEGQPLELLPQDIAPGQYPRPFAIAIPDDPTQSAPLAAALFKPSAERLDLGTGPGTLRFQYQDAAGLTSQKTFYFQANGHPYELTVEASVEVGGAPKPVSIYAGAGIGVLDPAVASPIPTGAVQFRDGSVERVAAATLQAQPTYEGAVQFAGIEDQFFVMVAVPKGSPTRVDYSVIPVPVLGSTPGATRMLVGFAVRATGEASPSRTVTMPFYIGPKEINRLREVHPLLINAIDFGMFAWLVRPLLDALKWINQFVGNYGWSIIVLTVLINVIIFPLRHKSMVSMRKMQTLQPQVKAIQDRYKSMKFTDPERQKMNSEMLGLYKQHGVNPASGCVPMLLTMPILFAFYAMLSVAIELRGAPFGGWIDDLSSRDPLYITPIVMGATMFWQQRMMPTTADPVQQKVFLLLPVVFTVMFLSMPSGLVLYWTASNLLTIAQQYVTNRLIAAPAKPPRLNRKAQA